MTTKTGSGIPALDFIIQAQSSMGKNLPINHVLSAQKSRPEFNPDGLRVKRLKP